MGGPHRKRPSGRKKPKQQSLPFGEAPKKPDSGRHESQRQKIEKAKEAAKRKKAVKLPKITLKFNRKEKQVAIANSKGEHIALGHFFRWSGANIMNLSIDHVKREFQGMGLESKLLRELIEKASAERGVKTLRIEILEDDEIRAKAATDNGFFRKRAYRRDISEPVSESPYIAEYYRPALDITKRRKPR
jgi:GNAT superfamily N-acetyltransferase